MNKEFFLNELANCDCTVDFFHKYIVHGTPHVFDNDYIYFDFRKIIAEYFKINYFEVFVVGSAKLGFSYRKDKSFSLESDIDVVIVNRRLFDEYSQKIADFQYKIESENIVLSVDEKYKYTKFKDYLIKGWLRPDKIPQQFQLKILKDSWFEFFKSISYGHTNKLFGNYKVAAGLFKDFLSVEKYYQKDLERIKRKGDLND